MSNKSISNMLENIGRVLEATHTIVDAMGPGDRMQLKELAQTVGLAVAMEPKHVLGFVNHFVHNSDIAYVTRGKNGGVIKGTKPERLAKPTKDASPSLPLVEPEDATDE